MRISGINIPDDKQIAYGLTAVYGIGLARAKEILISHKIDVTVKPPHFHAPHFLVRLSGWWALLLRQFYD